MRRAPDGQLKPPPALALGVLHGPAELLPVSSSAHTTLVPWLLGWSYPDLDAELRKAFEVALHAGTAAALLIGLRDEVAEAARGFDRRRATLVLGSFVPPAIVGYTLERPIERRLGTPPTIAVGLLLGAAAMAAADPLRAARRGAARAWRPGTGAGRRAGGATRPASSTLSPSASPRPARSSPGSRATA